MTTPKSSLSSLRPMRGAMNASKRYLTSSMPSTGAHRKRIARDPDAEDGTSFIGDSIDCGEFDTWYYKHCGKEDWWATVSAIMDKVAARDLPPDHQDIPAPEKTAESPAEAGIPIISVTIENARKPEIGGFTIPLPYPREALTPWLEAIEADAGDPGSIKIAETRSSIQELHSALWQSGASLNELAYLAAKIDGFSAMDTDIFCAALAPGKFDGDIAGIINLTENLAKYELQPAFDAEQYGEFLLQDAQEMSTQVFERLEQSEEIEERRLAAHITRMEKLVSPAAYAESVIAEEKGAFSEYGYLTLHGELDEKYHGAMDIPSEFRLLGEEKPPAPEAVAAPAEKESVIAKIRAAKAAAKAAPPPRQEAEHGRHKESYEPEV